MRHHVFGRKLNRDSKERKALFKSLILSLIARGKIKTTLAKAKAVHGLAEKLVTTAKDSGENSKKKLYAFFAQKDAVQRLVEKIAPVFKETPGGYIRIRRTDVRSGDGSQEVILEWSKQIVEDVKKDKTQKKKKQLVEGKAKSQKPEGKKKT